MKGLVAFVVLVGAFLLSLPHLQPLLLRVLVDQKVEQLTDDMKELVPSVDPELPLEFPASEVENNVAGEVALP
jgi:hypothetical protein